MKAIINGTRYDTEKAEKIGEAHSGHPASDFHFWEETLYVTPKSRRYFVAGEGGALSRYASRVGDDRGYSRRIIPMEKSEAFEWAEQNLTADEIEEHFGDLIEDA